MGLCSPSDPTQGTQGLPTGRLEAHGCPECSCQPHKIGKIGSPPAGAPHCHRRCSPTCPPGWAPLVRARDDVPGGAVPGSALLAHWQDFAAVCSKPAVWVTKETCRKQHCWWTGSDGALGRAEAALGEGGALFSPPISSTCREGRRLLGMGASRVAMVTSAASSGGQEHRWCSPAWLFPPSPSWLPSLGSAGFVALLPGDRAMGLCQVSSEQSQASRQPQPVVLRVCGAPPSPRKVSPPFPWHVPPPIHRRSGLQGRA